MNITIWPNQNFSFKVYNNYCIMPSFGEMFNLNNFYLASGASDMYELKMAAYKNGQ